MTRPGRPAPIAVLALLLVVTLLSAAPARAAALVKPLPGGLNTPSLAESWQESRDHLS